MWALGVHGFLPRAQIQCFDCSDRLFPTPGSHCSSISFSKADFKEQPPTELDDSFDLIHIRAMDGIMEDRDWERGARTLSNLLKPGGAIQWTETDLSRAQVYCGEQSDEKPKSLMNLVETFQSCMGKKARFDKETLMDAFTTAGMIDVDVDVVPSDRLVNTRRDVTENLVAALLGWAKGAISTSRSSSTWSHGELKNLEAAIQLEISKGTLIHSESQICTSRR